MKPLLLIVLASFCSVVNAQTTNPAPYCGHEYDDGTIPQAHYISSFSLGSFTNVSGTVQQSFPHYIFYNNLTPGPLALGHDYTMSIQFDPVNDKTVAALIDYNQDGFFDPTNENIYTSNVTAGVSSIATIVAVPFSSDLGITRLRIMVYEDVTSPYPPGCTYTLDWGETEDYDLEIVATVGVNDLNSFSLVISPNPVMDQLTMRSDNEIQSVIIYNTTGQKVFENNYSTERRIELSVRDFPKGLYNATIVTDGKVISKTFMKE